MNDLTKKKDDSLNVFDYTTIDNKTSEMLQAKAYKINQIASRSAYEIGKELKGAQDELAKKGYGFFEEWYSSLGFKKTKAYQYINHYNFVRSESEQTKIEMFESAPKSIQAEISKPSANEEVNEAYFKGDITTLKEFKEMEKKYQEKLDKKENEIKEIYKTKEDIAKQLEREQNKEPEKIEVVPDEYKTAKENELQLAQALKEAQQEAERIRSESKLIEKERNNLKEQLKDVDEKSVKYEELTQAIQEMEGQMTRGQKRIQAQKDVYDLVSKSKELLIEITPIPYVIDAEYVKENEYAKKALLDVADQTDKFLDNLRGVLDESRIIEGVVIDE